MIPSFLLSLKGLQQSDIAKQVENRGLSVRETEQWVRRLLEPHKPRIESKKIDPNIRHLQDDLSDKLGAGVQIQHQASGKGKMVISYNSLDELDGILAHIK